MDAALLHAGQEPGSLPISSKLCASSADLSAALADVDFKQSNSSTHNRRDPRVAGAMIDVSDPLHQLMLVDICLAILSIASIVPHTAEQPEPGISTWLLLAVTTA